MVLCMIKDGKIPVAKYKSNSSHDIQYSGMLVADDHCTIKKFEGTMNIIPVEEADKYKWKTYFGTQPW